METFVSVEKYKGQAVVKVRIGSKHLRYPLTKKGCLQAGRELFRLGAESWMTSSSVDFPEEVKPRFQWDVRELMSEGFGEELNKAEAPRNSLVEKMMERCGQADFQATLTDDEKLAYVKLTERIASNDEEESCG